MLWLQILSLLLPEGVRYEWLREWHAEMFAIRQQSWTASMHFLRGAWADVFAQRQAVNAPPLCSWNDLLSLRALSWLVMGLAGIVLLVPASRSVLLAPAYVRDGVVLLHAGKTKISAAEFEEWTRRMPRLHLRQAAFYSVSTRHVNGVPMRVAVASPELLQVLHLDQRTLAEGDVVLSDRAARRLGVFSSLRIGGVHHPSAGIVPQTTLRLPDEPEVFLITQTIRPTARGYVIGEKMPDAYTRQGVVLRLASQETLISYEPMAMRTLMPWRAFCFAVMLALLALPASQPLSSRDAVPDHRSLPLSIRARATGFVLLQMLLTTTASGLVALIAASLTHCEKPADEGLLLAIITFIMVLPLIRIVLHGHRHRCPHCLRPLGHPAQVGSPSASFLNWYGTEFVCSRGHGLVHVPDMPTTWFPAPRWVAMDASWAGLFE